MASNVTGARQQAANASKCYLLELSGGKFRLSNSHDVDGANLLRFAELLNRIYDFASEEVFITYHSDRLQEYSNEDLTEYGYERTQREFIGLAQTCTQLRQEYLPIYAAKTSIRVCIVDLGDYMRSNLPHLARSTSGKITGDLIIDCSSDAPEDRNMSVPDIELAPLLAHCRNNPDLRVHCGVTCCGCSNNVQRGYNSACLRCKVDWSEIAADLQQFLDATQDQNAEVALDGAVASIALTRFYEVTIRFKGDRFEEFVTAWLDRSGDMRHTLKETGHVLSWRTLIHA